MVKIDLKKISKINKLSLILTIILTLFLLFSNSAIATPDFSLTSQTSSINICPGSTFVIETKVTASKNSAFTISQSGDAAKFTISVPTGFFLEAGNSKTIFSYVTPPSTTNKGRYTLKLIVNSEGESKSITYKINVEDCREVSLQLEQQKDVCPGKAVSFKAIIKNEGKFTEDYSLNVLGPAKSFSTLSDTRIRLEPGKSKEFFIFFVPPKDASGSFDFTLTASSNLGAFASVRGKVNVLACYDYALSAEKAFYEVCEANKIVVPLTLENKGTVENSFTLSLNAPNFAMLEENKVTLTPKEKKIINLIISPGFGIKGNFPINVNIVESLGGIRKILTLTSKINQCYDVSTDILSEKTEVCNAFSKEEIVSIKNTGKFEGPYSIKVTGANFVKLSQETLTLKPGEEKELTLIIKPQETTPAKTYNVEVITQDKISKAKSSDSILVTTFSKKECFLPELSSAQESVEVPQDSAAAVSFTLENKGKRSSEYVLELSGNALSFVQINPSSLLLDAGKSETIFLHIAPSINIKKGDYELVLTARVKDSTISDSKKLKIKVVEAGKLPVITPTNVTVEEVKRPTKTIFDSIKEFLKRLFKIEITSRTAEINKTENVTTENITKVKKDIPTTIEKTKQETKVSMKKKAENIFDAIKRWFSNLKEIFRKNLTETSEIQKNITNQTKQVMKEKNQTESEDKKKIEELKTESITKPGLKINVLTSTSVSKNIKEFVKDYAYYIVAALIIIILIILIATGYWKKIVDFFIEEEEPKNSKKAVRKTNRRPNKKRR